MSIDGTFSAGKFLLFIGSCGSYLPKVFRRGFFDKETRL